MAEYVHEMTSYILNLPMSTNFHNTAFSNYITPFTTMHFLIYLYTLKGHTIMWTHYLFYVHVTGL